MLLPLMSAAERVPTVQNILYTYSYRIPTSGRSTKIGILYGAGSVHLVPHTPFLLTPTTYFDSQTKHVPSFVPTPLK